MQDAARIPLADLSRDEASPLAAAMALQDRQSVAMVQAALQARRVRLAFQPVVLGAAPDRVGYWEGLTRVLDDTGRAIPAREFMPAVEGTEAGRQIDCLALETGLATLRQNPGLRIAINMSARSIGYPRWQRILKRELAARRGVAERLILEISETSALVVPEHVTAFMADVRGEGVAFAMDDFGEGFTSFRHLRPVRTRRGGEPGQPGHRAGARRRRAAVRHDDRRRLGGDPGRSRLPADAGDRRHAGLSLRRPHGAAALGCAGRRPPPGLTAGPFPRHKAAMRGTPQRLAFHAP
jgi:hypothetical protein